MKDSEKGFGVGAQPNDKKSCEAKAPQPTLNKDFGFFELPTERLEQAQRSQVHSSSDQSDFTDTSSHNQNGNP